VHDLNTQVHQHEAANSSTDAATGAQEPPGGGNRACVSSCLLDVFQGQLQAFQALIQAHAEEQARQRLKMTTTRP
jgi:hypothetical protein